MAITIKDGDIFQATEHIIAHQVNGIGEMGGGKNSVATQIKQKYPNVFFAYRNFVGKYPSPESMLGLNFMITTDGCAAHTFDLAGHDTYVFNKSNSQIKIISNLFGQAYVGTSEKQTNTGELQKALELLLEFARISNLSIAIPYGIGCGLGGGDWNEIHKMLEKVFHDYPVTLYKLV